MVDPFNLPNTCPDAYGKRKKDARGEGYFGPQKKKKVEIFLDEDEVPLSECQKAMILKDTSGVVQQSSNASDASIPGKSSTAKTFFVSDSNVSQSVLPTPPPPSTSNNIVTIPNPILQPPPTNITLLEPITETSIVSKTHI